MGTAADPSPSDLAVLSEHILGRIVTRARGAVVVSCASAGDIAPALHYARRHGLAVSAGRGGADGLCLDLKRSATSRWIPEARTVRAGAGATWRALDAATQAHALAVTGARVSTTSVAAHALGSGSGSLSASSGPRATRWSPRR